MPAELALIANNSGQAAFWSNEEKAWHGLGQITTGINSSEEIIKLSGLDFEVVKKPLLVDLGDNNHVPLDNRFATVRTDTNTVLGQSVSGRYEIVPNRTAFSFFDEVVGKDGVKYETAGALRDGSVIFVTAKLDQKQIITGDGERDLYLVFTNSHDGSSGIRVLFSSQRVVCANTLAIALKDGKARKKAGGKNVISIRHSAGYQGRLDQAKELLGIARHTFEEQKHVLERAVKVRFGDDLIKELTMKLICEQAEMESIGTGEDIKEALSARKFNQLSKMLDCQFAPPTQQPILGTALGFLEGITYYTSHVKYPDKEKGMYSELFGESQELQQRAFDLVAPYL